MEEMEQVYVGQRQEAELVRHLLEDAGIPVMMQSRHGAAFALRAGDLFESYFLYAAPDEAKRARDLIHAYFEAAPEVPDDELPYAGEDATSDSD